MSKTGCSYNTRRLTTTTVHGKVVLDYQVSSRLDDLTDTQEYKHDMWKPGIEKEVEITLQASAFQYKLAKMQAFASTYCRRG